MAFRKPAAACLGVVVVHGSGDAAKMRRQDVSGGAIHVVQQKTGTELSIPIHPALAEAMQAGPNNGMSLIGDQHGRATYS
jgi:hypothetical protein